MSYKTIIEITLGGKDVQIEIEGDYHSACRGARSQMGVPLEPDEPAWIEIVSSRLVEGGAEVELDDEQTEAAQMALEAAFEQQTRDAIAAQADGLYEALEEDYE